jgi:hypothetical protein
MPSWKKIATTAVIVVVVIAVLNRVANANPQVAKVVGK